MNFMMDWAVAWQLVKLLYHFEQLIELCLYLITVFVNYYYRFAKISIKRPTIVEGRSSLSNK